MLFYNVLCKYRIYFEKKSVKFFVLKTKTVQICLINTAL